MKNRSGSITAILTIGTLVVIGAAAILSSLNINKKQTTSSKAAAPVSCNSDTQERKSGDAAKDTCSMVCGSYSNFAGSQSVSDDGKTRYCCCKKASTPVTPETCQQTCSGTVNGKCCTDGEKCKDMSNYGGYAYACVKDSSVTPKTTVTTTPPPVVTPAKPQCSSNTDVISDSAIGNPSDCTTLCIGKGGYAGVQTYTSNARRCCCKGIPAGQPTPDANNKYTCCKVQTCGNGAGGCKTTEAWVTWGGKYDSTCAANGLQNCSDYNNIAEGAFGCFPCTGGGGAGASNCASANYKKCSDYKCAPPNASTATNGNGYYVSDGAFYQLNGTTCSKISDVNTYCGCPAIAKNTCTGPLYGCMNKMPPTADLDTCKNYGYSIIGSYDCNDSSKICCYGKSEGGTTDTCSKAADHKCISSTAVGSAQGAVCKGEGYTGYDLSFACGATNTICCYGKTEGAVGECTGPKTCEGYCQSKGLVSGEGAKSTAYYSKTSTGSVESYWEAGCTTAKTINATVCDCNSSATGTVSTAIITNKCKGDVTVNQLIFRKFVGNVSYFPINKIYKPGNSTTEGWKDVCENSAWFSYSINGTSYEPVVSLKCNGVATIDISGDMCHDAAPPTNSGGGTGDPSTKIVGCNNYTCTQACATKGMIPMSGAENRKVSKDKNDAWYMSPDCDVYDIAGPAVERLINCSCEEKKAPATPVTPAVDPKDKTCRDDTGYANSHYATFLNGCSIFEEADKNNCCVLNQEILVIVNNNCQKKVTMSVTDVAYDVIAAGDQGFVSLRPNQTVAMKAEGVSAWTYFTHASIKQSNNKIEFGGSYCN